MLVQNSSCNSSVAGGWSRARCNSKGSSAAPSVHCDSGKSDTDGTPRALGRKKRSFKLKSAPHSTRNYLRRQQGEAARNVEADTAGDGAPAQQCCVSVGGLSSSRHRLLFFVVLVTAATWLIFLDRIGQSTFDIVHRGSHTFSTVSRRVTGWDSAEAYVQAIRSPAKPHNTQTGGSEILKTPGHSPRCTKSSTCCCCKTCTLPTPAVRQMEGLPAAVRVPPQAAEAPDDKRRRRLPLQRPLSRIPCLHV